MRRTARNLAVGAITAVTVSALERPIVSRVSTLVEARRWGLVQALPGHLRSAAAIVLMDYTLYWWHVLLHRVPALWRLHVPHHIDRDLDATTGVRFHFLEFIASIPWRCAQIVVIGTGPTTLALWQRLTLIEVLFHHSNLRLPLDFERVLGKFAVTPRMHGMHHSVIRREHDSNFSSGLSVWDRLHETAGASFSRDEVTIGLPESGPGITLGVTLAAPFTTPRYKAPA